MASTCPERESSIFDHKVEIAWGHDYRVKKKLDRDQRGLPTKKVSLEQSCKIAKLLMRQTCPKKKKRRKKKKEKPPPRPTFLQRSALSHKRYMTVLSRPKYINARYYPPVDRIVCPKKLPCEIGPCPPRTVMMACPKRRLLFETWKRYAHVLPPDTILRIDDMLHTEQNVELEQAMVCFKQLDRTKRKKRNKKKKLKAKREREKMRAKKKWFKKQINEVADAIITYIRDEPLFDLNYKQLLFSDGIMDRVHAARLIPKLNRKTKNVYKQSLIEISDKLAVWIDALMQFVENQYVESDSDIPKRKAKEIEEYESEIGEEMEEEEEGEEEVEGEEEGEEEFEFEGEEELEIPYLGEEGEEGYPYLIEDDPLTKLIHIYDNCTEVDLSSNILDERYPLVTYSEVLQTIKTFTYETLLLDLEPDEGLENLLYNWAMTCDSIAVDIPVKNIIPIVASNIKLLLQELMPTDMYDDMGIEGMGEIPIEIVTTTEWGEEVTIITEYQEEKEVAGTPSELVSEIGEEAITYQEEKIEFAEEYMEEKEIWEAEGVVSEKSLEIFEAAEEEIEEEIFEKGEVAILYEKCQIEGEILAHKPPRVLDHVPGTICCLSLKIWSVWLLEITHNAHNWTKWMSDVIRKVRDFAAIIRGEVLDEDGQPKQLFKADWRKFCRQNKKAIRMWYDYSKHVKDLNDEISREFRGKRVTCCPKCLQDHIIKDVVAAHDTFRALTEAMDKAAYWHCTLEEQMDEAALLQEIEVCEEEEAEDICEPSIIDIHDLLRRMPCPEESSSGSSVYLLEEIQCDENEGRVSVKEKSASKTGGKGKGKGKDKGEAKGGAKKKGKKK